MRVSGRGFRFGLVLVGLVVMCFGASCSGRQEPQAPVGDGWRKPFDSAPSWSPDGALIAFTRGVDGTLRLVNVRSGRMRLLSDGVHNGGDARWSPSGSWLAYVRGSDNTLRVADIRTGRSIQLLNGVGGLAPGAWSPDQRSLIVTSKRDNTRSTRCFGIGSSCTELYVVRVAGGTPRRLTHNLTYEKDPVWSPDGKQIAVLSGHDPDSQNAWRDVRVVLLSDGNERLVTNDGRVESSVRWTTDNSLRIETDDRFQFELTLNVNQRHDLPRARQSSPFAVRSGFDGTLAYTSTRDRNGRTCREGSAGLGCTPNAELYLRLLSGRRIRVTHSRVDESDLVWSPNGQTLAFQSGGRLLLVNHDGHKLRTLIAK